MKKTTITIIAVTAIISSALTAFADHYFMTHFPDVEEGSYYEESVYHMKGLGVISGYKNGNFGPNDAVTRAQLATILSRYDDKLVDPLNGSGIADLVSIVCSGLTAEDMGKNEYMGSGEFYKERFEEVCLSLQ